MRDNTECAVLAGGCFWIIIGFVTVLCWLFGGNNRDAGSRSSALEILEKRYARGEISHEEFEQRRRDLGG